MDTQLSQYHLLKTVIPQWVFLAPLLKKSLSVNAWIYFLDFYSLLLVDVIVCVITMVS
jgi:hypothetical protein